MAYRSQDDRHSYSRTLRRVTVISTVASDDLSPLVNSKTYFAALL